MSALSMAHLPLVLEQFAVLPRPARILLPILITRLTAASSPTLAELATAADIDLRTAQRGISALEASGFLTVHRSDGGRGNSHRYILNLPPKRSSTIADDSGSLNQGRTSKNVDGSCEGSAQNCHGFEAVGSLEPIILGNTDNQCTGNQVTEHQVSGIQEVSVLKINPQSPGDANSPPPPAPKKQKPKTRKMEKANLPVDEQEVARVFQLADWWCNAIREARQFRFWSHPFREARPWESQKRKTIWWWNSLLVLSRRLTEWNANPRHFLAAIMASYLGPARSEYSPSPRQVSGPKGKAIWEAWLKEEQEKWGGQNGSADTAAVMATQDQDRKIQRAIKDFYECALNPQNVMGGGTFAVNATLRLPEVLCVALDTEPGLQPYIDSEVRREEALRPQGTWIKQWRELRANLSSRSWLLSLRQSVLGNPRTRFPQSYRDPLMAQVSPEQSQSRGRVPRGAESYESRPEFQNDNYRFIRRASQRAADAARGSAYSPVSPLRGTGSARKSESAG